ncbi:MAG TPA: alginate export family protein, partial [Caballeronia sp.]|nr:alginate export family protein [Caballeronia sp.]
MTQTRRSGRSRRLLALSGFTLAVSASGAAMDARAASDAGDAQQPAPTPVATCDAKRPAVLFNRWQEDWSVLANPCVPREPLDGLKYMPLGSDPASYLSLGANLRERLEVNNAALFGVGANHGDTYLLQRAEVHADIRLGDHLQIFAQIEDAQPYGKDSVSPVDKNPLDLEQAFITYVGALGGGTFKFRLGRQEMAFDLQRFISVRDGPNVR